MHSWSIPVRVVFMANKKKGGGRRSGLNVAMIGRHPRKQVFKHRNARRTKDARAKKLEIQEGD